MNSTAFPIVNSASHHSRSRLIQAMESSEFDLWMQPKLNMSTSKICGVEALTRWHHPMKGLLLPSDFINSIEDNGLMNEFSSLVFGNALRVLRDLQDSGHKVSMSINITWDWLLDPSRSAWAKQQANSLSLSRNDIILEFLETTKISSHEMIMKNLQELRESGFLIALDDFGTGYNSMQVLRQIPFTHVKLDRTLVDRADKDKRAVHILECLMNLAHHLGVVVVGEGVENRGIQSTKKLGLRSIAGLFNCQTNANKRFKRVPL